MLSVMILSAPRAWCWSRRQHPRRARHTRAGGAALTGRPAGTAAMRWLRLVVAPRLDGLQDEEDEAQEGSRGLVREEVGE
jgi:hypothetical protein